MFQKIKSFQKLVVEDKASILNQQFILYKKKYLNVHITMFWCCTIIGNLKLEGIFFFGGGSVNRLREYG